jgi:methylenetetrahydrofolate--tRNA-(uracil-5-)-methyltransferase
MSASELIVIGGGLAGSEAAWQAAERGIKVKLYEMRPKLMTGAHITDSLGELVCSNSLGSLLADRASGVLMNELRRLNSMLLSCAYDTAVPAGSALAVDRELFARKITVDIENHPNISVIRKEVRKIPQEPCIIASGPLTSLALSNSIAKLTSRTNLYFFDAIAPIIMRDSINMEIAFKGSRYGFGSGEGDYINCPMTSDEYHLFVDNLIEAESIELKSFEHEINNGVDAGQKKFFEGCLPVEVLAKRGREALAYGPLRPIGLIDPRTGRRPYAVVQLRQDNLIGDMYNIVGFQTNLNIREQNRVFHMIPGLELAEFARFGQMHRNTFIYAPDLLDETLRYKNRKDLFFAGQITGVEGYVGNIATGLLAGWNIARIIMGKEPLILPRTTMLGALCYYITHASARDFQPMKANFGLLPSLGYQGCVKMGRNTRRGEYSRRALSDLGDYLKTIPL